MKDTKYLNQSKAKIGALYRDIKAVRDGLEDYPGKKQEDEEWGGGLCVGIYCKFITDWIE